MNRLRTAELSRNVVWHGRSGDLARLFESARTHCACEPIVGPRGVSRVLCGPHQILTDQHTLDHLAFARSVQERLMDEEWRTDAVSTTPVETAEWSALFAPSTGALAPHPGHRWDRWARIVRTPFAIPLFALALMLGMPAPGDPAALAGPVIASWQTR